MTKKKAVEKLKPELDEARKKLTELEKNKDSDKKKWRQRGVK